MKDAVEPQTYPGVNRSRYFLYLMGIGVVSYGALAAAFLTDGDLAGGFAIATFILFGLGFIASIYLVAQRFRNQGASGWWAAGTFVPLLNLYVSVRALAYPTGYNDHKKFDTPAKIIIGLFVLFFGAALVAGAIDALTQEDTPVTEQDVMESLQQQPTLAEATSPLPQPTPNPPPAQNQPAAMAAQSEQALFCEAEIDAAMNATKVDYAHCEPPQLYELQACANPTQHAAAPVEAFDAVTVLDVSGSMAGRVSGMSKMQIAADALNEVLNMAAPTATLGLMTYGHLGDNTATGKSASCVAGEFLAPVGSSATQIREVVSSLKPTGWTPIAATLEALKARVDADPTRPLRVTVISDGKETCGGDPVARALELKEAGADVSINVIGFEVGDAEIKQLRGIAKAGGGVFFDAKGRQGMRDAALAEARTRGEELLHQHCTAAALAKVQAYSVSNAATYRMCVQAAATQEWLPVTNTSNQWRSEGMDSPRAACIKPLRAAGKARYDEAKAHANAVYEDVKEAVAVLKDG